MKHFIFIFFLTIYVPLFSQSNTPLDTINIRGDITVSDSNMIGTFIYTLKNNSNTPQTEWTFFINHSSKILSASYNNNSSASISTQNTRNHQIATVSLPTPIPANGRGSVSIRFSIDNVNNNSRMIFSSQYSFLDARQFWFPYPVRDNYANFEIVVRTQPHLYSIMGGYLRSETLTSTQRVMTWKNELQNISPGLSLIITDMPREKKDSIYIYGNNQNISSNIHNHLLPFWNTIKNTYRYFPLTEIHILPLEITIPSHTNQKIDGEFLGNIFLLNPTIIKQVDLEQNTKSWYSPINQIMEVIIHELHHSFFPGIIRHVSRDSLFIESLVQYLSWDFIGRQKKSWNLELKLRTRFQLQNLYLKNSRNNLWKFLYEIANLYGISKYAHLDGTTLIDTLIEKYRFIPYSKLDVFETIMQYKYQTHILSQTNNNSQISLQEDFDIDNFLQKSQQLYNSSLDTYRTNFNITVTNAGFFQKKKIVEIPVDASFISIQHDFPFTWTGELVWIEQNSTNFLPIEIPQNEVWETNLIGNIQTIQTRSPWDILEHQLYDNISLRKNTGQDIINFINNPVENSLPKVSISSSIEESLQTYLAKGYFQWDSTHYITDKELLIQAFFIQENQRVGMIGLSINLQNMSTYHIQQIIDQ